MNTTSERPGVIAETLDEVPQPSLTEGGPGAALLKRLRLVRPDVGVGSPRTAVVFAAITWPPLLLLSIAAGVFASGAEIPFWHDLATHTRFLFSLPLLILAEVPIGNRTRRTISHFVSSGLVPEDERQRFGDIAVDMMRFRDSTTMGLIVLALAYVCSYGSLKAGPIHGVSSWYQPVADGPLTVAGYWYAIVALPLFQFVILRWMFRMVVWTRFLSHIAKLNLRLMPTHPDGAAGLAFLGKGSVAFGSILLALSAVISAGIASNVLFAGAKLENYQQVYIGLVALAIFIFCGPLLVFAPTLLRVKQTGLLEYGVLANRYTQLFHRKWVVGIEKPEDPLLGTGDIQSLADLGNSYELVKKMRIVPIELNDFIAIAIPAVLPGIPLLATVMPVGDIVKTLFRLIG